ncbi:hypothetical protein CVT26_007773 [Gymnopilus dilepis]|uniref:Uncharacterized protein n=1 Tax=Gymnopilus dilepis TaxID=231916 RepID=A0A409WTA2_9AGAR|nr:hypothetical protein CVT26_007773 [Gymnopilus dilepis]
MYDATLLACISNGVFANAHPRACLHRNARSSCRQHGLIPFSPSSSRTIEAQIDPEGIFASSDGGSSSTPGLMRPRVVRFVDALAGLAAPRECEGRVACGICVSEREVEVILAGSAGCDLAGDTAARITAIWDGLVRAATLSEYSSLDGGLGLAQQASNNKILRRQLYALVLPRLRTAFELHLGRIKEWFGYYERWCVHILRGPGGTIQQLVNPPLFRRLMHLVEEVEECRKWIEDVLSAAREIDNGRRRHTGHSESDLVDRIAEATRQLGLLMKSHWENLAKADIHVVAYFEPAMRGHQLIHALQDLIDLPCHIRFLSTFASTSTMRSLAARELVITPLAPIKGAHVPQFPYPWPKDEAAWQRLAEDALDNLGYRFYSTEEMEKTYTARRPHDFSKLPCSPAGLYVHPELQVAIHLGGEMIRTSQDQRGGRSKKLQVKKSSSKRHPISYVGTSDYSCAACYGWEYLKMPQKLWVRLLHVARKVGLDARRSQDAAQEEQKMIQDVNTSEDREQGSLPSADPKGQSATANTSLPRPLQHFSVEDIIQELFIRFAPGTNHSRSTASIPLASSTIAEEEPRPQTQVAQATTAIRNVNSGNVSQTSMSNCGNNYSVNYSKRKSLGILGLERPAVKFVNALAGLAAPRNGDARIACAISLSERAIEVILAGNANCDLAGDTSARITSIWQVLTAVASVSNLDDEEHHTQTAVKNMRRDLYALILPRLYTSFIRHLGRLKDSIHHYEEWRDTLGPRHLEAMQRLVNRPLFRQLTLLVEDLEGYQHLLEEALAENPCHVQLQSLAEVADHVQEVSHRARLFLETHLERLAETDTHVVFYFSPSLPGHYMLHALQDLIELPSHIHFLEVFATTSSMRSLAARELLITPLPHVRGIYSSSSKVAWPANEAAWQTVGEKLFDDIGHRFCSGEDWERVNPRRRPHDFSALPCSNSTSELAVHPELQLAVHLGEEMLKNSRLGDTNTNTNTNPKTKNSSSQRNPICYIGTSDYSCFACTFWMNRCNESGVFPREIFLRGAGNSWDADWCMPEVGRAQIEREVVSDIVDRMVRFGGVVRMRSRAEQERYNVHKARWLD